jgi:cytidyltransferase-like protein
MAYQYHHALIGGTFDRFHSGHKKLLRAAFEQSEKVLIGIATVELFRNKSFSRLIEDYKIREESVSKFLSDNGLAKRSEIIPIHDIYGPGLESNDYDAIFVTKDSKPNALKINEERDKRDLRSLEIVVVPLIFADDGEIISSGRIREGLIDREGKSYLKLFEKKERFILPEDARGEMRRPIGEVYTNIREVVSSLDPDTMIIAVGDIVAASLAKQGRQPDIGVIDGKTRREIFTDDQGLFTGSKKFETKNPAGTISREAVRVLHSLFENYSKTHEKQLLKVLGEEDLLAIPMILLAPLSAVVVYGQFDQGIVVVEISEQNKKRVYDLFGKFK